MRALTEDEMEAMKNGLLPPDFEPGLVDGTKRGDTQLLAAGMRLVGKDGKYIAMDFGMSIQRVSVSPDRAVANAAHFRRVVKKHFGDLSYDPTDFPMKVVAEPEFGLITTEFPSRLSILMANPEVFLVWADKLEEVAKQMTASA